MRNLPYEQKMDQIMGDILTISDPLIHAATHDDIIRPETYGKSLVEYYDIKATPEDIKQALSTVEWRGEDLANHLRKGDPDAVKTYLLAMSDPQNFQKVTDKISLSMCNDYFVSKNPQVKEVEEKIQKQLAEGRVQYEGQHVHFQAQYRSYYDGPRLTAQFYTDEKGWNHSFH